MVKTAEPINESVRVEYDEAAGYARAFTRALSSICDSSEDTDLTALTRAWSDLSSQYGELSNSSKQTLQNASFSGIDDKAKAVAFYDYIVGKYSQLANFMSRSVNNSNVMGREINTSHADMSLAVIVVITLTITSLGAYFFLHKKRHN